jgi:peptidoglycan-associated lipoprotein
MVAIFVLMRQFFTVYSSNYKRFSRERDMIKFKKLVQAMIVTCGLLSLVACKSMHKSDGTADGSGGSDVNGAAQTSGMNEGGSFGGDSNSQNQRVFYFEFDRSEITDSDKPAINANADNLIAHPSAKILLEGHTDPRGSREYNVALGERRANAVANMMKAKGVNPDQIRVISYGAERLALPGHDEEAYQKDRRVVLVYLQK